MDRVCNVSFKSGCANSVNRLLSVPPLKNNPMGASEIKCRSTAEVTVFRTFSSASSVFMHSEVNWKFEKRPVLDAPETVLMFKNVPLGKG